MQAFTENGISQERRQYSPNQSVLWDRLSITQKFSANSLTQFGYELSFVRQSDSGNIAVLLHNQNTATVDVDGEINTCPHIKIRP